jgi:transposase
VVFHARDLLVRQRTQLTNALRGHLLEYGWITPEGLVHMAGLIASIEDPDCRLPESACAVFKVLIANLNILNEQIAALDVEIVRRSRQDVHAPAAKDHSRCWSRHCDSDCRFGSAAGKLSKRL